MLNVSTFYQGYLSFNLLDPTIGDLLCINKWICIKGVKGGMGVKYYYFSSKSLLSKKLTPIIDHLFKWRNTFPYLWSQSIIFILYTLLTYFSGSHMHRGSETLLWVFCFLPLLRLYKCTNFEMRLLPLGRCYVR